MSFPHHIPLSHFLLSSYFIPFPLMTVILKSLSSSMPQFLLTVFSTAYITDCSNWETQSKKMSVFSNVTQVRRHWNIQRKAICPKFMHKCCNMDFHQLENSIIMKYQWHNFMFGGGVTTTWGSVLKDCRIRKGKLRPTGLDCFGVSVKNQLFIELHIISWLWIMIHWYIIVY